MALTLGDASTRFAALFTITAKLGLASFELFFQLLHAQTELFDFSLKLSVLERTWIDKDLFPSLSFFLSFRTFL